MKRETADRLATAFDRAATEVSGGSDLRASVAEITRFLETLLVHLKRCDSVDTVRAALLGMEEPSHKTVRLIEGTLRFAPRITLDRMKQRAKDFLTRQRITGRPTAVPVEQYFQVCAEIAALELRGASHPQAKREVARKYRVNNRTIHRIWSNRPYPRDGITMEQSELFITSVIH